MRLNLGSGRKKKEGWTNVDILDWDGNTDIRHDLTQFPYPFEDNNTDEIMMVEVLEHISWRLADKVLAECYRILKSGGKLHIQVPDCGEMMFMYWNKQICSCVFHKPKTREEAMAKLDCPFCQGYGRIHPDRWLMAFCGAQKHEWDFHRNIFTREKLEENLENAGFNKINIGSDDYKWKIKADCYK